MIISVPSYNLLYAMDEVIDPSLTIKVVGHQWYWSYECSDFVSSPQEQQDSSAFIETGQSGLKKAIDSIKSTNLKLGTSENRIQISLSEGLLNDLNTKLQELPRDLSKEESENLCTQLELIGSLISKNELNSKQDFVREASLVDSLNTSKNLLSKINITELSLIHI